MRSTGVHITDPTIRFVDRWIDFALSPASTAVATSPAAHGLICDREIQLKRAQARVKGGRAIELWQGASGTRRLNYRWGIASQMLVDMNDARVGVA